MTEQEMQKFKENQLKEKYFKKYFQEMREFKKKQRECYKMKQEEITDEFFKDVKIYFVSPHKGGNPHLLIFKKWNPNINKCLKNVVKKSNITYIEEGEYTLVKRRSAIQININGDCFRYAWQSKNCFFYRFYK